MFRIDAGKTFPYCDGLPRRSFLQLGVAGMASVGLSGRLRAKGESAAKAGGQKDPSAIVARELGSRRPGMPAHVAVPYAASIGLVPGYFGGHFLGAKYDPFTTQGDANTDGFRVPNLEMAPGLTIDRLDNRRKLYSHLD